ncbi:MAG: M48 family metallopeptidase [Erysipelotrichaceae bacterium]|nr:M48 family metallopeptidase [Erysipelotrichaceae bacterium]
MIVKINDKEYPVLITRKRIKHMYLRVSLDGELILTCSNRYSINDIISFIHSKADWIEDTIEKQKNKLESIFNIFNEEYLYFLGKRKRLIINESNKTSIQVNEDNIIFFIKDNKIEVLKKEFYKYSTDYLLKLIDIKRNRWDIMLKENNIDTIPDINIKLLKSRWGFCVPTKNKITLNATLIHYPIGCIDYVLLHEYAHLIQPNHSKKFYNLLEFYMPEYKEYIKILKNGF